MLAGRGKVEAIPDRAPREPKEERRTEQEEPLARRIAWAELLKRVFAVDALRCPDCGGRMRLISAITQPDVVRQILESLLLPSRAPPIGRLNEIDEAPDRSDAEDPPRLDQNPADERADSESDPGFEFDQTRSAEGPPVENP